MLEKFHYTTATGAEITLPRQDQLPVGVIRKARKLNEDEQVWVFIEAVADEASLEAIDALPLAEFQEFITEWTSGKPEEGEAGLGESEPSSTPSTTE